MSGRVLVGGAIAQKPGRAGHAWQYLQYLLGLRRLGWEVLFVDRAPAAGVGSRWLADVMDRAGLRGAWTLQLDDGTHLGVPRDEALRRARGADLLVNVMGFVSDEELLAGPAQRVFLDTDPGFGQMWLDLGLTDIFAGHDRHVTIGERIGRPGCGVPTCGIDWITSPQPVVLDAWPVDPVEPPERWSSIAAWRGAYGPIEHGGHTYGLRVHQFRRFADLPRRVGGTFDLALDIHPDERADSGLLRAGGWTLHDPLTAVPTIDAYRTWIRRSAAEIMIAKGIYVDTRSGWVSERSLCYLASGRPVLAQDTGFTDLYPTGEGLLAFATPEEAAAGVAAIRAEPARHRRAAREIAEAHFGSDLVLTRLLDRLGTAAPARRAAA